MILVMRRHKTPVESGCCRPRLISPFGPVFQPPSYLIRVVLPVPLGARNAKGMTQIHTEKRHMVQNDLGVALPVQRTWIRCQIPAMPAPIVLVVGYIAPCSRGLCACLSHYFDYYYVVMRTVFNPRSHSKGTPQEAIVDKAP